MYSQPPRQGGISYSAPMPPKPRPAGPVPPTPNQQHTKPPPTPTAPKPSRGSGEIAVPPPPVRSTNRTQHQPPPGALPGVPMRSNGDLRAKTPPSGPPMRLALPGVRHSPPPLNTPPGIPEEDAPPAPPPRDDENNYDNNYDNTSYNNNDYETEAGFEGQEVGGDYENYEDNYGGGGEEGGDWGYAEEDNQAYHDLPKKPLPPAPGPAARIPVPPPPANRRHTGNSHSLPPTPSVQHNTSPTHTPLPTPTPSPAATPTSPRATTGGPSAPSGAGAKSKLKAMAGKGWKSLMAKEEKLVGAVGGAVSGDRQRTETAPVNSASSMNSASSSPPTNGNSTPENPVFGVPLADAARISDKVNGLVPAPVTRVIKWFAENGYDEEGLYRRSGSVTVMQKYIDEFNRGIEVNFAREEHPINVAGVLKSFLLKLPDPLFTVEYRGQFGKLCTIKEQSMRIATLQFLLSKLPLVNRETIREIAKHMHIITLHEEKNKMNPTNLGTSMGATWSAVMPALIEAVSMGLFPPETVVFGVSIEESLRRSDPEGIGLPAPFRVCYDFLKPCTNVPYLYKASVDQNIVYQVITAFNSGTEVSLEGGDPLIVGEVLKHYMKHIEGSIFTAPLYGKFLSVNNMGHDEGLALLKGLMWELPETNFSIIQKLVDHFYEVSQNFIESKMTALDIASCWGEIWVVTLDYFINCYDALFNQ